MRDSMHWALKSNAFKALLISQISMAVVAIKKGTLETTVTLMRQLPEFHNPYTIAALQSRTTDVPYLNLIAFIDHTPVGFKLGYERTGYFYSWLGGVLPAFRKKGIAKKLADAQEAWAKENHYASITFKTRNRHKAMLTFAINNGFNIIKTEEHRTIEEYRIWLRKNL